MGFLRLSPAYYTQKSWNELLEVQSQIGPFLNFYLRGLGSTFLIGFGGPVLTMHAPRYLVQSLADGRPSRNAIYDPLLNISSFTMLPKN